MVLHIDTNYIEQYGLDIRELWVWTALKVLASNKPWQGTYQQLAKKSNCGGKSSAQRAMQVLLEKGLVIETEDGFSVLSQNGTDSSQNGTDSSQNGTDSKESTKENIILRDNNSSSLSKDVKSKQPPQPVFFDSFSPPDWKEVLQYASEKKIPESLCIQFFSYYTANGWTLKKGAPMQNWKAVLTFWVIKEKTKAAKQVYQSVYGKATTQEQATYACSQYAEYEQRKERERQAEIARQQNPETRYVSYEEYKKMQQSEK